MNDKEHYVDCEEPASLPNWLRRTLSVLGILVLSAMVALVLLRIHAGPTPPCTSDFEGACDFAGPFELLLDSYLAGGLFVFFAIIYVVWEWKRK